MTGLTKKESFYAAILKLSESPFAKVVVYCIMALVSFGSYCFLIESERLSGPYAEIASIFLGVIAATLCASAAKTVLASIAKHLEDSRKLTKDYASIIAHYPYNSSQFYVHANPTSKRGKSASSSPWSEPFPEEILYCNGASVTVCKRTENGTLSLDKKDTPMLDKEGASLLDNVDVLRFPENLPLRIEDNPSRTYVLPAFTQNNYVRLFESHKHSKVINSPMLRISESVVNQDEVLLKSERTTFFNSLVTNRALDVELAPGLTSRSVYGARKRPISLQESPLSNHLGIHCLIATSDGWHVFVRKRKGAVSIGKGMAGIAVMGSFKLGEGDSAVIDSDVIYDRLFYEIKCELDIDRDELVSESGKDEHFVAFYRDWVEGGKPQLLFAYRCTLTALELSERFAKARGRSVQECDGEGLAFLHASSLSHLEIHPDGFRGPFIEPSELLELDRGKTTLQEMVERADRRALWLNAMPSTTVSMALGMASPGTMRLLDIGYEGSPTTIIESLCVGKLPGAGDDANQDRIAISPWHIAVIDGATAKSSMSWDGMSSGRFASEVLCTAVSSLPKDTTAHEALAILKRTLETECERALGNQRPQDEIGAYPSASLAVYSAARNEIWLMGDVQCMVSGIIHAATSPRNPSEARLAERRAKIITGLLKDGWTVEDVRANDRGRAAILPELTAMENESSLPSISGNPKVYVDEPLVVHVPSKAEIVIASDGYPILERTLEESESALRRILKADPLCISEHKATKASVAGGSFDDRTYIRLVT